MDQYHLNDTLDYANNMLNSNHHLMNQHQLQSHQTNQPQYTQLHSSQQQHHNLNNNNVINNLNNNVTLMNGQKTNGNSNGQVNGNLNGTHHNGTHNNGTHNQQQNNHSINGNHQQVNGNSISSNNAILHSTNVRHSNAQQQQHLNQQLMQMSGNTSPQQLQHNQLTHDHLHSLDNNSQLTNLTNSTTDTKYDSKYETKYTPPNQSMKRKLDDYIDPQLTNDNLLNEDESPMKKLAQSNGKKTKGRVKIKMEFIDNKLRRYTTFSKRKTGIMKKAYELSTLTGTQVMLLVASETGHVYTFATRKLQPMITSEAGKALIQTCLNSPDAPNNILDQRMSQTGFEETDLSYSIHDDSSEKLSSSGSSFGALPSLFADTALEHSPNYSYVTDPLSQSPTNLRLPPFCSI